MGVCHTSNSNKKFKEKSDLRIDIDGEYPRKKIFDMKANKESCSFYCFTFKNNESY
jgi:hypothetical protein